MTARSGTKAHGQLRRGQVITTWGPGALIDLPRHSAIMGGLDGWPEGSLEEIVEPRLEGKLRSMTGVRPAKLYAPPAAESDFRRPGPGIQAWRFPEWFVVREDTRRKSAKSGKRGRDAGESAESSRRIVHRKQLDDNLRFDGCSVVPTRFVRACPRGHIDDLNWRWFVHERDGPCLQGRPRQLWLDEGGTVGDLSGLVVRCDCGKRRRLYEAADLSLKSLGTCTGARPWLGKNAKEGCDQPARLLIRTATNAYFSQVVSVLSLPDSGTPLRQVVEQLWDDLQIVESGANLAFMKKKPKIAKLLEPFPDEAVLEVIREMKSGVAVERPVKQVELDAILSVPEGFGDDVLPDRNFYARRLPEHLWRHSRRCDGIASVVQLHRLREVLALIGFTRFEAVTPDIHGEYETDVQRADLARLPSWFPAVENRGEGMFLELDAEAVTTWLERDAVKHRLERLAKGHEAWQAGRKLNRAFPGGPYILLHTLSHLLIQSLAMRCGYPASSIRERIYAEESGFGILLFTGSPDAEGTLGGLVQQARQLEEHLRNALDTGGLCSNDPICAQHVPGGRDMEGRHLQGAACHGCALVAETSCEMRNDYLDRALVVPVLGQQPDVAFFSTA